MPLFSHNKTADQTAANTAANTGSGRGPASASNQPMSHAEADPLYNNERGSDHMTKGDVAGYHIPGVGMVSSEQAQQMQAVNFQNQGTAGPLATSQPYHDAGMGMGTGHQNSAMPQGGMTQGTGVAPGHVDRDLANQAGSGHGGMGSGTGAGAGAGMAGAGAGAGMAGSGGGMSGAGTGGGGGGNTQQADLPDLQQAKKLERSGKIDKFMGSITGNTNLKNEGLQKQADAAAVRAQTVHLTEAQRLEQEAQMRRGTAVGLGAHPSHAMAPGQMDSGVQPSHGPGMGAPVGAGVGGGQFGGLK